MKRGVTTVLLVLALVAAGCSGDDGADSSEGGSSDATTAPTTSEPAAASAAREPGAGWLFVVDAEGGTSDGSRLALTRVDSDLVAFGDRPARRAERLPTSSLIDDWSLLGFDQDPPNAAVTVDAADGVQTAVVVLRDPVYDAGTQTLSFSTEPVADAGAPPFGHGGAPVETLPPSFGHTSVFVDTGESSGQPVQGEIEVIAVPEGDFQIQKEKAQQASRAPCVTSNGLEICQLLTWNGEQVSWSLGVALLEGDDDAQSSFKMTVVYPGQVYAEAVGNQETDSQWIIVDWMRPGVDVPGAGLELEVVAQIGETTAGPVSCVVPSRNIPLDYYCFPGTD